MNFSSSVIPEQIDHFNAFAKEWWNPKGPMRGLHLMNPARLSFIADAIGPVAGLKVLDVGCGGGLMAEPLARQGATVTGIDAGSEAIAAATAHAAQSNLSITYLNETAEAHKGTYDVVLALDLIEHVDDPAAFVKALARLVKPTGHLILSTLNRTVKSYLLGILVAEHIAGLAPKGSHEWSRFIEPAQLASLCRTAGLRVDTLRGLSFNPLTRDFTLSRTDLGINYMLAAQKG